MNKQAPKENFADLAADLAMIIADVIDHPNCPQNLRDGLNDPVANELIDILTPSISTHLRAVASLAKSGIWQGRRLKARLQPILSEKRRQKTQALRLSQ